MCDWNEHSLSSIDTRIELDDRGRIRLKLHGFTRPAARSATHDADVISRHLSDRDRFLVGVRVVCSARLCASSSRQAGSPPSPSLPLPVVRRVSARHREAAGELRRRTGNGSCRCTRGGGRRRERASQTGNRARRR